LTSLFADIPDLERMLTRIYTYSMKTRIQAFYIDAKAKKRADEFRILLEVFEAFQDGLKDLA